MVAPATEATNLRWSYLALGLTFVSNIPVKSHTTPVTLLITTLMTIIVTTPITMIFNHHDKYHDNHHARWVTTGRRTMTITPTPIS